MSETEIAHKRKMVFQKIVEDVTKRSRLASVTAANKTIAFIRQQLYLKYNLKPKKLNNSKSRMIFTTTTRKASEGIITQIFVAKLKPKLIDFEVRMDSQLGVVGAIEKGSSETPFTSEGIKSFIAAPTKDKTDEGYKNIKKNKERKSKESSDKSSKQNLSRLQVYIRQGRTRMPIRRLYGPKTYLNMMLGIGVKQIHHHFLLKYKNEYKRLDPGKIS